MNASDPADVMEVARSHVASHEAHLNEKKSLDKELAISPSIQEVPASKEVGGSSTGGDDAHLHHELPTEGELTELRRVAGPIPWTAYTVAFVELCERFSYYGTTAVCTSSLESLPSSVRERRANHGVSSSRQLHSASPA